MTERPFHTAADPQRWQEVLSGSDVVAFDGVVPCFECRVRISEGDLIQVVYRIGEDGGGLTAQLCAFCRYPALPNKILDTRRDTIAATGMLTRDRTLSNVSLDALHPPTDLGEIRTDTTTISEW